MTINEIKNDKELTVKINGRVDSATSDELMKYLSDNFTSEIENLVLDFAEVDFISSKGLRVLVSVYKGLNNQKMKIINSNASVKEVLRLSGLLEIFNVE